MLYDIRQGQMLVQGVSTYHINRRMSTRIMIYYFYYTTMDLFPVRVMISDLKLKPVLICFNNCFYVLVKRFETIFFLTRLLLLPYLDCT